MIEPRIVTVDQREVRVIPCKGGCAWLLIPDRPSGDDELRLNRTNALALRDALTKVLGE